MAKTRAAILVEQAKDLIVDEVGIPKLGVGQSLVKVSYSGICGKQLEEISGRRGPDAFLPHLLGHEGTGVVVETGPGVRKVKAGDHVVLHWIKGSGIDSEPPRYDWNGRTISAGWVTTFSDFTVVSENRMTKIPADTRMDAACLLGCAVTTGLGIVFNNAALTPGQSIVVFGAGGVGVNVILGAALVNAYPIVAVDVHDDKLEQARHFGATHTINSSREDVAAALMTLTGGKGADATVDTTGIKDVREVAYNATSTSGRTILAGVPHHQDAMAIDSFPIHMGRRIIGVHGGDTKPDVDVPRYLQLYARGRLNLDDQISDRYELGDVNAAVEKARSGGAVRCVLSMNHG